MIRNVGIVGRKRSGKDTAAAALVEALGYARHGLADPLKEAALALDPWIEYGRGEDGYPTAWRLSEAVGEYGWEESKDQFPEVRRILQRLGDEAGRQVHGERTWVDQLLRRVADENAQGRSVVVPDVRYPNEADELRRAGFLVVRIDRPGFCDPVPGEHASEQVERLDVHRMIVNDDTVTTLKRRIYNLAQIGLAHSA